MPIATSLRTFSRSAWWMHGSSRIPPRRPRARFGCESPRTLPFWATYRKSNRPEVCTISSGRRGSGIRRAGHFGRWMSNLVCRASGRRGVRRRQSARLTCYRTALAGVRRCPSGVGRREPRSATTVALPLARRKCRGIRSVLGGIWSEMLRSDYDRRRVRAAHPEGRQRR